MYTITLKKENGKEENKKKQKRKKSLFFLFQMKKKEKKESGCGNAFALSSTNWAWGIINKGQLRETHCRGDGKKDDGKKRKIRRIINCCCCCWFVVVDKGATANFGGMISEHGLSMFYAGWLMKKSKKARKEKGEIEELYS